MTDKVDHTKCKCGNVKPPTHSQCPECDKDEGQAETSEESPKKKKPKK